MKMETLKQQILTAKGDVRAELVLKNARVINVFTNEIEQADVAIRQGVILGVGHYTGETELDLQGKYVCPGLVDGHIHIESSMLCGPAFEQAVLPHGTTAVVTDPHEISNVAGTAGLDFMLETTKDLALSVYFMLPSCVPATGLDESGAVLEAEQLRPYYQQPRVLGLAELMNSYGTVRADEKILQKICDCTAAGKRIDGHAPFLSGEELNAYIAAGVQSDHECSDIHEAMEKLRRGQYIMVREGTAAQNMESLLPLFREPYCSRCMLVTDDKHPRRPVAGRAYRLYHPQGHCRRGRPGGGSADGHPCPVSVLRSCAQRRGSPGLYRRFDRAVGSGTVHGGAGV